MRDLHENSTDIRICIDKPLPKELQDRAKAIALAENVENAGKGALLTQRKWRNGTTLRVRFLGGHPDIQEKVRQIAPRWSEYANMKFTFGTDADAEIRVAFTEGDGSWSRLGTDALAADRDEPTMNFGWLHLDTPLVEYERVVLHEFGHALGLIHEHQHPEAGIPWNKPVVYDYFARTQGWSKSEVDFNLFEQYAKDITQYSAYDRASIMHYSIEARLLTNPAFAVGNNQELSRTDKDFIALAYPKASVPITELFIGGPDASGRIGQHGAQDRFRFRVVREGAYVIETKGSTDVVMGLFDSRGKLVAEDDDSGQDRNARLALELKQGTYDLRVRHYRPTGVGLYTISIKSAT